jgi:CheY-like chemotaxis protein/anti-sigma regulatory factor (Ser/Thr protein kinase)
MSDIKKTILVVDDEEKNVRLLKLDLEDAGYEVVSASDGVIALDILRKPHQIELVLLDRMMPNMNGMELLKIMKADPNLSKIPVIMQTAAAEKQQVIEGITSGVYYYLAKPFEEDLLLAIVKTAIEDYSNRIKLREKVKNFNEVLGIFSTVTIHVRTLQEAQGTAAFIANILPQPDEVITAVSELLINAVEHGNLGIDYSTKKKLVVDGKWQDEIEARLLLPQYKDKFVMVQLNRKPEQWELIIEDQGNGFDYSQYLTFAVDRATDPNGRGIAISVPAFSKMEYQGNGNKVVCLINKEVKKN